MKIYHINTNAYEALIAINEEEKTARCLTDDKCEICPACEVEDTSSWEEIDFDAVCDEMDDPKAHDIEIIDMVELDYDI